MDEVIEHWPERCGCGHLFSEAEHEPVGEPARHQVAELPPIAVVLTEHRLHRLCCPGCGQTLRAALPAGVPPGAFGARLQAAVATLSVRNRVSRRDLVELVEELFGCPLSTGTVDAIVQRTGEALALPYEGLLALWVPKTRSRLQPRPADSLSRTHSSRSASAIRSSRGRQ